MTGIPTRHRTGSSNPAPRPDSPRRSGAHTTPHSGPCPHSSPARTLPWSAGAPTRRHPPYPSATPVASPAVRHHDRDATTVVFGVSRSSTFTSLAGREKGTDWPPGARGVGGSSTGGQPEIGSPISAMSAHTGHTSDPKGPVAAGGQRPWTAPHRTAASGHPAEDPAPAGAPGNPAGTTPTEPARSPQPLPEQVMLNRRSLAQAQPAAGAHSAVPAARKLRHSSRHDRFRRPERPERPISVSRLVRVSSSWLSNWPMVAKWVDIW